MRVCTIASGSSGNCCYVGSKKTNILIDAGISCKRIVQGLEENTNISGKDIDAVLVTHEHTDHIQSLGVLARRFKVPLYATKGTWQGIGNKIGEVEDNLINIIQPSGSMEVGDINVEWFPTSHDAEEPIGYLLENEKKEVGLATDSGMITKKMENVLKNLDLLILEANHDLNMLAEGKYPYYLKRRIKSNVGHLSNISAGEALLELAGEKTQKVYLAHLSQENNLPTVALRTVQDILEKNNLGYNFELEVAPRKNPGVCCSI